MRDQLARRPIVVAFLALCVGLTSGFVPWHALGAVALFWCLPDRRSRVIILVCLGMGWLLRPVPPERLVWERHPTFLTGRVASVPSDISQGQRRCLFDTGQGRFTLTVPDGQDVSLGDTVRVGGELGPLFEGSGDSRGAVGHIKAVGGVEVVSAGPFVGRWGLAVRDSFRRFVDGALPPKDAALVDGIAFNVTSGIDEADHVNMVRAGIVHVVSTSGVHVVLVAGMLAWLARRAPMPRTWSLAALGLLLVVYACASGLRPPMVRAVLMALMALSAYLFRREPDGPTSLAAAGLATLVVDPWAVVDVGFWLSVVAVGALVLFVDPFTTLETGRDPRAWLTSAWRSSLVATAATLPVVATVSGSAALAAPLANLVAVPASETLLGASLASWLVSLVVPVMGKGLLLLTSGPLLALLRGAAAAGSAGCVPVPALSPYWCPWLYGIALAFWRPWVRPA
ncbi:MAG: ComEC/Rec2 family competence protein [Fimbriimonadaceae bacterium]|nr:ComEC/Rec2 family competence protein [Fimbriimonadaceae bacterium]